MMASLNGIFSLLTQGTGSLIYHLMLVFSIAGALQSSFVHWRSSKFPQARRTMFGLGMLLVAQIALFLVSGLGVQGFLDLPLFLPPLDRAVTLFSLVWLIWLWAFPKPSRPVDAGTSLLSLLVLSALGLSLVANSGQNPILSYNSTVADTYWQLASIAVAVPGLFLLALRRPNGWGYGLTMFLVSFVGHLFHLLFGRIEGDLPGAVRLAHLAAYPILMTLPQRFTDPSMQPTSHKQHADEKMSFYDKFREILGSIIIITHKPNVSKPKRLLKVFLCHSSGDKSTVRNLYLRLHDDGFEPWLDEEVLLPGQDWDYEIQKAVRSSDVVIVCLSQSSITKTGYVQKEIRFALDVADTQPENSIFIIPVKIEDCDAPDRLKRWQWVNLFQKGGYDRLKQALILRARDLEIPSSS